jgi:hypothetical protein
MTPQSTLVEGAVPGAPGAPVYTSLPALAPVTTVAAMAVPIGGIFDWIGLHPYLALGFGGALAVALVAMSGPKRRRRR